MVTGFGAPSRAWPMLTGRGLDLTAATWGDRQRRYAYLDAWETGEVLAPAANPALLTMGIVLRQDLRLYEFTRLLYNPFPQLTDFWGSAIYPGLLTRDGQPLPDGTPSAIPFAADTAKALITAASQIWWWSGMGTLKYLIGHWAARDGNMLLEIVDDGPAAAVYLQPRPASEVRELVLDSSGDVDFYSIQYPVDDPLPNGQTRTYIYRRDVGKDWIATFRGASAEQVAPYAYAGNPGARWRNPYGFVPAAWIPHQSAGAGKPAVPAIRAGLAPLLELNSMQSAIDDGVYRATKPLAVFITEDDVSTILPNAKQGSQGRALAEGGTADDTARESILGIRLRNGSFGTLNPSGDVASQAAYYQQCQQMWLRGYPELVMWDNMRAHDVPGVTVKLLQGDTILKIQNIAPGTDRQLVKATQMAISIAVRRFHDGTWRTVTGAAQQAFAGFVPDAWERGDLAFEIAPRSLIPTPPPTPTEQAALADTLQNKLDVSPAHALTLVNVPPKFIKEVVDRKEADRAQAASLAAQPPPPLGTIGQQLMAARNGGNSNGRTP
jgi:hypothetical protein